MQQRKSALVATYGLLIALALILSYIESIVPAFFAVPGMKIGLANIVVLYALYCMDAKSAMGISLIRVALVALLFGNGASLWYSLAGALCSFGAMVLLKKSQLFQMITVSIVGGVVHNLAQIVVAVILLQTKTLLWYFVVLWFVGMASGAAVGLIGGLVCARMKRNVN